jgi:hypothetical protein
VDLDQFIKQNILKTKKCIFNFNDILKILIPNFFSNLSLAIKILNFKKVFTHSEYDILKRLDCPYLIKLGDVFHDTSLGICCFVTEFCEVTNFENLIFFLIFKFLIFLKRAYH